MAISAGNYIIRSALSQNIVITTGGSTAKGAAISTGGASEANNRNYWKVAVVNTSYNRIYNIMTGATNGNLMAASVADNKKITQGAYASGTGRWSAVASGNTMVVDGVSVNTYFLKAQANANLYLTAPTNGGQLYLTTVLDDTTPQEWYFEPSTYVDKSLATPNTLYAQDGKDYRIGSGAISINPLWKSASTNTIYEMRYRSRQYDMDGVAGSWSDWSAWTMIQAAKRYVGGKFSGFMRSATAITSPGVDNTSTSQADIQVSVRLTSAANAAGYNKTGTVTHGPALTGILKQWKSPTLTISAAECTQYGIKLTYASTYTIGGNKITVNSIKVGSDVLVSNYVLADQDYQGDIVVPWNNMAAIPANGDSIVVRMTLLEKNGIVSVTNSATLTISYDSEAGLSFTPTYTVTDRGTIEAKITAYDDIECYMRGTDLRGEEVWIACDETASSNASYRTFEVIPPFGTAPTMMWAVKHTTGGNLQWGYKKETLGSGYSIPANLFYYWNWVDDDGEPHAYIMKYRAGTIVQPGDDMTLPANKFVTTGRDYPIYRYTKSISRNLSIEGAILNGESGTHATLTDAEALATANHTVYRQPNGKWYQTALTGVAFSRELYHHGITIGQEAESR